MDNLTPGEDSASFEAHALGAPLATVQRFLTGKSKAGKNHGIFGVFLLAWVFASVHRIITNMFMKPNNESSKLCYLVS